MIRPLAFPLALTVKEAGAAVRYSQAKAYDMARKLELPVVELAGQRRVPTLNLLAMLNRECSSPIPLRELVHWFQELLSASGLPDEVAAKVDGDPDDDRC